MIHIQLPYLPPSDNNAYATTPNGFRVMTKEGKKFKADVTNHVVKHHGHETQQLTAEAAVGAVFAFGFPNLLNRGYPKRSKTKYKKLDVNNRLKLLADALIEAMVIDDSQIMLNMPYKYAAESEETNIWIWNEDVEPFGRRLIGAFTEIVWGPGVVQPV